jgi:hypothetical protein
MRLFLLTLFIGLFGSNTIAQILTYPTQDCVDAITLCNNRYDFPIAIQGSGRTQELLNVYDVNPNFCLINGENNSVWFKFVIDSPGTIVFYIEPISLMDDYDFAIFDVTSKSCTAIVNNTAPFVRCTYSLSTGVPTGLAYDSTRTSSSPNGPDFLAPLQVDSGEVYYLVIDNFTRNGRGFSIDFAGTTAGMTSCDSFRIYTGVEKLAEIEHFKIYPNPTQGEVSISLPYGAQTIEVVDISGKLLMRVTDVAVGQQVSFNTDDMPQGLYFVRVQHQYGIATQKLQVIH